MKCESCQQNDARVHIIDLADPAPGQPGPAGAVQGQRHLCEGCAREAKLQLPQMKKQALDIWKMLQSAGQKQRRETQLVCPDCGMTLSEFREKGRLGCPRDYEVFSAHLEPLLERIHNAKRHQGRLARGQSSSAAPRGPTRKELEERLAKAIKAENYELAAELRDQLRAAGGIEAGGEGS
jgi:protein arginine kinase activator